MQSLTHNADVWYQNIKRATHLVSDHRSGQFHHLFWTSVKSQNYIHNPSVNVSRESICIHKWWQQIAFFFSPSLSLSLCVSSRENLPSSRGRCTPAPPQWCCPYTLIRSSSKQCANDRLTRTALLCSAQVYSIYHISGSKAHSQCAVAVGGTVGKRQTGSSEKRAHLRRDARTSPDSIHVRFRAYAVFST